MLLPADDNVVSLADHPAHRRRPEALKHEGGYYQTERRIWHDDTVCRDFQEAAAWNYIFGTAEHETRYRHLDGHEFRVERSQKLTSERALARFFGWSNHRVHRFLERLIEADRIDVKIVPRPSQGRLAGVPLGILITVYNYDFYQAPAEPSSQPRPTVVPDASHLLKKERRKEGRKELTDTESGTIPTESRPNIEIRTEAPKPTLPSTALPDGTAAVKVSRRRRETSTVATRIGDWEPPPELRQWSVQQGIGKNQVREVFDEFHDFWVAQPGIKGCKADWPATWRNWIRRIVRREGRRPYREEKYGLIGM